MVFCSQVHFAQFIVSELQKVSAEVGGLDEDENEKKERASRVKGIWAKIKEVDDFAKLFVEDIEAASEQADTDGRSIMMMTPTHLIPYQQQLI